jgi:hypothetical protein
VVSPDGRGHERNEQQDNLQRDYNTQRHQPWWRRTDFGKYAEKAISAWNLVPQRPRAARNFFGGLGKRVLWMHRYHPFL